MITISKTLQFATLVVAALSTGHLVAMESSSPGNEQTPQSFVFDTQNIETLLISIQSACEQLPTHDNVIQALKDCCGQQLCNITDSDRQNVLHKACLNGCATSAEIIIQAAGERAENLVFATFSWGFTPLHCAAIGGVDVVEVLMKWVEKNGKIRILLLAQNDDRETALHVASRNGEDSDVVERLVSWAKKGDSNLLEDLLAIEDWNGKTASALAEQNDHQNIVQILNSPLTKTNT